MGERTCCFCREPDSYPQNPYGDSELSVIPGGMPSSGLLGYYTHPVHGRPHSRHECTQHDSLRRQRRNVVLCTLGYDFTFHWGQLFPCFRSRMLPPNATRAGNPSAIAAAAVGPAKEMGFLDNKGLTCRLAFCGRCVFTWYHGVLCS